MYRLVEQREEWREMARHGADFLVKHGMDHHGQWYFSLTREGKPLIQPYNIFSDCFAAMGLAAFDRINPAEHYRTIARSTLENILRRRDNPKGHYSKVVPGTRPLKNFSLPMILCNLVLELRHLLDQAWVDTFLPATAHEVTDVFYNKEEGLILENVLEDGSFSDSFEGRLVNPGHGIEATWFVMDIAERYQNRDLLEKACTILLNTLEFGWDRQYGGIFAFLDIKGKPPQQLEWDQKLWWVHCETLVALAKGYALTRNERCKQWFEEVHEWTWTHFTDQEYPEWFGYLNRRGEVLLPLKGGKWKGCFHIPRALYHVSETLNTL
jgi:N-acylglucosamine 2-epimerase